MGIRVTCPGCQASLRVREQLAGKRGQCPKCGAVFTVPALSAASAALPPEPPAQLHTAPPVQSHTAPPAPSLTAAQSHTHTAPPVQIHTVPPPISQPPPHVALPVLPAAPASGSPSAGAAPPPAVDSFAAALAAASDGSSLSPVVDIALDEPARRREPERRRTPVSLPLWAWGVAAVVLLALGAAGALFFLSGGRQSDDKQPAAVAHRAAAAADAPRAEGDPPPARGADDKADAAAEKFAHAGFNRAPLNPSAPPADDPQKPPPGAPLEDVVAYVKHGIVKIETSDRWNNRRGLGSGFVIDRRGLVATTYHVVADAAKADVVFSDGTRYGIEGYLGIDPHADLAVLRLNGVPPTVKELELNYGDGPRDAAQVYAIGHPHDNEFTTTGGIVGRVLRTSQLPDDTRQWLNETLSDSDDDLWIQHDARISPGNSGGPLINARGEVVGVNSWVNQKLGLGYAIHAKHLHELMGHEFAELVPLRDRRNPEAAQPQFAGLDVGSDRIRQLRAELASKGWRPRDDKDCATFDELARTITAVKYIQSHAGVEIPMPRDEQQAVVREADDAVAALRAVRWKEVDQIRPINAHGGLERQPYSGAFVFATVKRLFRGDERENGLLISLIGGRQQFFVPLEASLPALREGDKVLVLGIAHPASVRVGDGPRNAQQAQVLLSKVVLPLGR